MHYLLIWPNTEKCKSMQAVKELLHFTLFRIQARSTAAKIRACTLALWYISNGLKQLQCIWRKFGTHLGFYNKQLGEVYVKKFNGAKTETFLHCANFWNAAHYASVDHNILWAGCTAGWNAAVEIDKGGKHCRAVNLYCTSALLHWQSCASLVLSSFANGSDDWQSSGSPLFWRLLSRIEKVCGRLSGSGSVIHSTVGKTDSSSLHCTWIQKCRHLCSNVWHLLYDSLCTIEVKRKFIHLWWFRETPVIYQTADTLVADFWNPGLSLVLEYGRRGEGGGMYAEGWWLPLTLNYFPFRSIFPTLKTLSASERGSVDLQKMPFFIKNPNKW